MKNEDLKRGAYYVAVLILAPTALFLLGLYGYRFFAWVFSHIDH